MQSIPGYYSQSFPPASPYPTSGTSTTTSSAMSSSPAPIMAANLPPMQAQAAHSMSATPATDSNKRKQVKNACTNCQKACKKCDDARPCPRCIKYGISDACVNSVRKERKKGIKRGPYKRRQKPGDESTTTSIKAENNSTSNNGDTNNTNGNGDNGSQFSDALRGAQAIPFGYPSNLNQYGQPYDPYGSYQTYGKDQILPQSYVMNYPQVSYPVLVPATTTGDNTNSSQQQAYTQLSQQHFTGILTQRSQQQQTFGQQPSPFYQKTSTNSSEPSTTTATNATSQSIVENVAPTPEEQVITAVAAAVKVKDEMEQKDIQIKQEEKAVNEEKPQPMTPSTSNSSGTSSPSDTQEEVDPSKYSGLTQLCSAALDQDRDSEGTKQS